MTQDFSGELKNPCTTKKEFCINCHSHFMAVRPHIKGVVVTKHFFKDFKDAEKVRAVVKEVLDCSGVDFYELHKFEEHIEGNMIFRAKKEGMHIVYCVDRNMRLTFLRAFRNFKEYERFLEDKKEIHNLIIYG